MEEKKAELAAAIKDGREALIKKDFSSMQNILDILNEKLDTFTGVHLDAIAKLDTESESDKDNVQKFKSEYEAIKDEVLGLQTEICNFMHPVINKDNQNQAAPSKCGSTSSTKSARVRAATRKTALLIEMRSKQRLHEIAAAEAKLKQEREMLELETQLNIATEEEKIYLEAEETESGEIEFKSVVNTVVDSPKCVLDKSSSHSESVSVVTSTYHESLLEAVQAPKVEIPTFDGNPLKYFPFVRSFTNNVDKVLKDSSRKLTQLLHYTTGKANKVLQGCPLVEDPDEGYRRALSRLEDRFGNKFVISQAWVDKITKDPVIKPRDASALQDFADELQICCDTLMALNYISEVNTQSTLVMIINRLPTSLHGRWRKIVATLHESENRLPTLQDIAKFVEKAANEENHPIYGSACQPRHDSVRSEKQEKPLGKRPHASFSTSAGNSGSCRLCGNEHNMYQCEEFKKQTVTERFETVKKNGLCFNCLKGSHSSRSCRSGLRCKICHRRHNTMLHDTARLPSQLPPLGSSQQPPQPSPSSQQPAYNQSHHDAVKANSSFAGAFKRVALPILPVKVKAPGGSKSVTTYCLIDTGSTNSFISQALLDELNIKGVKQKVSLTTLEKSNGCYDTNVSSIEVTDIYETKSLYLPAVMSRDKLTINEDNIPRYEDIDQWPHLRGLDIPQVQCAEIGLLVGQDTPEALMPLQTITGNKGEPYAVRHVWGYTIQGPMSKCSTNNVNCQFISQLEDESLLEKVESFWKMESNGVYCDTKGLSVSDKRVLDLWEETTSHEDGHYHLSIPFKDDLKIADSLPMAKSRLNGLAKKLSRREDLKKKYVQGINDLIEKGYAVKVDDDDISNTRKWYLPHHPVINPNKEKIRIVFDSSAKACGQSLNSMTHQGPDYINKLAGVLIRFRQNNVAVMADIQTMFYQCKVKEEDQDFLRFLWWENGDFNKEPVVYKMTVHIFGGKWSPSVCGYSVMRTVRDFGDDHSECAKNSILNNMYVDDLLSSVEDIETAKILAADVKSLLKKGGFELTKWSSNYQEALSDVPKEQHAHDSSPAICNYDNTQRALGILWSQSNDTMGYNANIEMKKVTKRGMLSMLSSIFDPLGWLCGYVLKARHIIQELCRKKIGWDENVPSMYQAQFDDWLKDLPNIKSFAIPRCYKASNFGDAVNIQLHTFCDASKIAYAACTYLRYENSKGQVCTALVMARSRLAPIKDISIPRLELTAAVLGVRQSSLVEQELDLKIDSVFYWTDSTIVLKYIKNEDKRFHTFVANRLEVIRNQSNVNNWRHIRSNLNPADGASRGLCIKDHTKDIWLHGPEFLLSPEETWPKLNEQLTELSSNDPEVKREVKVFHTAVTDTLSKLIGAFSSWNKLVRSVAWWLVLKGILRGSHKGVEMLQYEHLQDAQLAIIKHVQHKCYEEDIVSLTRDGTLPKGSSLASLKPFVKNGILQVGGRIARAPLNDEMKFPIILPAKNTVTDLLIKHYHHMHGHAGREYVLASIREKYWPISGRTEIRRILSACIECKKREAPFCQQQMADLPEERLTPGGKSFQYVGVDFYEAHKVKVGRATARRYGCLFTCLVTRAVHIEIAHSLSSDSFIQCLQRFIAVRGNVKVMYSDNGKNFVGAERELKAELEKWNKKYVQDQMNIKGIVWKFQTPYASSHSGVWERQIRSIRRILAGLSKQQLLTDESLLTLTSMATAIINGRPLTAVSSDPKDLSALTPNHFLILETSQPLPGLFTADDLYLRKRWKQIGYLVELFWRRYIREYLPSLQKRTKNILKSRNMCVGDLVLISEPNLPRNTWSMGRVIQALKGQDGLVRSIKLKTSKGEIIRPVNKVSLLEASTDVQQKPQPKVTVEE